MIQELLGGGNVGIISGERSKLSSPTVGILDGSCSHPSPSTASPSSASTATTTNAAAAENLRCPRCDSTNTKFCYYNNYNLTQPRHFCKTCRRYWTKGGALRNVPIGGGCRKNKSTPIAAAVGRASGAGKMKALTPEMGKAALFGGFEHAQETFLQSSIMWASPQNSHILSLLRANQNPSPNPSPLSNHVKEESSMFGSHPISDFPFPNGGLHARAASGFDSLGPIHAPSMGLSNSFYRSNHHSHAQPNQAIMLGEAQNNGIHELYQKLRSSTNCYPEHAPGIIGDAGSPPSAILESAPLGGGGGGDIGFWNPTLSWAADLPTTNGEYPN